MIARTDSTNIQFINPDTLEPIKQMRYHNIDPRIIGETSAAHGSTDHNTGDYFNYSLKLGSKPCYTVFAIRGGMLNPAEKDKIDILAEITEAPAAYLHSSFMTEKYIILAIWQADYTMLVGVSFSVYIELTIHCRSGLSMIWYRNVLDALDKTWKNDRPTFYYVIDRINGGVVAKYKVQRVDFMISSLADVFLFTSPTHTFPSIRSTPMRKTMT
jgi:torulene dioxygenase